MCISFLVVLSREIDALLHLIGILFSMSRGATGNMLLAWSSSLPGKFYIIYIIIIICIRTYHFIIIIYRNRIDVFFIGIGLSQNGLYCHNKSTFSPYPFYKIVFTVFIYLHVVCQSLATIFINRNGFFIRFINIFTLYAIT